MNFCLLSEHIFVYTITVQHKNTEMQLKENIRQQILSDDDTILAIAKATGKKFRTVFQWLQDNSEYLTLASSLNVIKEFTGLNDTEILEAETTAHA